MLLLFYVSYNHIYIFFFLARSDHRMHTFEYNICRQIHLIRYRGCCLCFKVITIAWLLNIFRIFFKRTHYPATIDLHLVQDYLKWKLGTTGNSMVSAVSLALDTKYYSIRLCNLVSFKSNPRLFLFSQTFPQLNRRNSDPNTYAVIKNAKSIWQ